MDIVSYTNTKWILNVDMIQIRYNIGYKYEYGYEYEIRDVVCFMLFVSYCLSITLVSENYKRGEGGRYEKF